MRDKYVEHDFPRYFIFGEHADGRVDIATISQDAIATVSRDDADTLIAQRDEVVKKLCDMASAFDAAAPEAFQKFWYGNTQDFAAVYVPNETPALKGE